MKTLFFAGVTGTAFATVMAIIFAVCGLPVAPPFTYCFFALAVPSALAMVIGFHLGNDD